IVLHKNRIRPGRLRQAISHARTKLAGSPAWIRTLINTSSRFQSAAAAHAEKLLDLELPRFLPTLRDICCLACVLFTTAKSSVDPVNSYLLSRLKRSVHGSVRLNRHNEENPCTQPYWPKSR